MYKIHFLNVSKSQFILQPIEAPLMFLFLSTSFKVNAISTALYEHNLLIEPLS